MNSSRILGLPLLVLALSHCGEASAPTCTIDASGYDPSCTSDIDCVGIPSGNLCNATCTNCPSAAINKHVQTDYQSALSKLNYTTRDCPCPLTVVSCVQGQCQAG